MERDSLGSKVGMGGVAATGGVTEDAGLLTDNAGEALRLAGPGEFILLFFMIPTASTLAGLVGYGQVFICCIWFSVGGALEALGGILTPIVPPDAPLICEAGTAKSWPLGCCIKINLLVVVVVVLPFGVLVITCC